MKKAGIRELRIQSTLDLLTARMGSSIRAGGCKGCVETPISSIRSPHGCRCNDGVGVPSGPRRACAAVDLGPATPALPHARGLEGHTIRIIPTVRRAMVIDRQEKSLARSPTCTWDVLPFGTLSSTAQRHWSSRRSTLDSWVRAEPNMAIIAQDPWRPSGPQYWTRAGALVSSQLVPTSPTDCFANTKLAILRALGAWPPPNISTRAARALERELANRTNAANPGQSLESQMAVSEAWQRVNTPKVISSSLVGQEMISALLDGNVVRRPKVVDCCKLLAPLISLLRRGVGMNITVRFERYGMLSAHQFALRAVLCTDGKCTLVLQNIDTDRPPEGGGATSDPSVTHFDLNGDLHGDVRIGGSMSGGFSDTTDGLGRNADGSVRAEILGVQTEALR